VNERVKDDPKVYDAQNRRVDAIAIAVTDSMTNGDIVILGG